MALSKFYYYQNVSVRLEKRQIFSTRRQWALAQVDPRAPVAFDAVSKPTHHPAYCISMLKLQIHRSFKVTPITEIV